MRVEGADQRDDEHAVGAMSRRAALAASMSAVIGGAVFSASACSSATPPTAPPAAMPQNALITLGVHAGPPPVPNKTGISSALNDYFSFFLSGGYTASKGKAQVTVYGPGRAGGLPASQVGNPDPATVDSTNPTPGLTATTEALLQAFAYTSNIFIRDMGTDDIQDLVKVTEIAVPPGSDYRDRSPKTAPFPVVTDDNVVVTVTLVSHYDVYPAFGFRFGLTKSGVSVTVSGDTTKSENLITLAHGTDILVHEAQFSLDDAYYHNRFPPNYLQNSHTSAEQVGEVAAAASAKHVVLSHYSPTDLPDSEWTDAIGRHYSGEVTVAPATARSSPSDPR
jgi:ribonuclease BN (tRNA processing enzyme)